MFIPNSGLLEQSNRIEVRFLLAEVDAGLTLLTAAATTATPGSRQRCLRNAREVYGVMLRLLPRVQPDANEQLELRGKMAVLRNGLIDAGYCLDF